MRDVDGKKRNAFTMLELLSVIAIIGVLVLLASPSIKEKSKAAKVTVIKQSIDEVERKIQIASLENTFIESSPAKVDKIIKSAKEGNLYSKRGLVELNAEEINLIEYYKVNDKYLDQAGVNIEGTFYYDRDLNVFYSNENHIEKENSIKSITILPYALWDTDNAIKEVERMELNTVNLGIRAEISDIHSNDVILNKEDLAHALNLAKILKERNVKIMIEPFPWIKEGSIAETELNPNNIDVWFLNWREEIIKPIIERFNEEKVELKYFIIASNFVNLEYAHGYWSDLLKTVKELSPNSETIYKINWWITAYWDKLSKEKFNSKINSVLLQDENLDIISVATYFELTEEEEPTYEEIKRSIKSTTVHNRKQNVYEEIKAVSISNNKPIIFGELGVPNTKGYAKEPWNNYYSKVIVEDAQYNYFRAYLEEFWDEDWFKGFSMFASGDSESPYSIKDKEAIKYLKKLK